MHEDAQRSGDHKENGPVVFAIARELRAARNAESIGLGQNAPKRLIADVLQHGEAFQPLDQCLRENRVVIPER